MNGKFYRELRAMSLQQPPCQDAVVTEAEVASLPDPVQRYLRYMGAIGKPRVWSLRVGFEGRFKTSRESRWLRCETIQYNSSDELARIFYMTIRMGPVPLLGRDTYLRGKGRMIGRAFDLVKVVDGSGAEFDIGELVTYLNDAILMAPSMLLGPGTSWTGVDDRAFDVAITDRGTTVKARAFLDENGAPMDFSTTDRFMDDPSRPGSYVRAEWRTPMDAWTEIDGRRVPVSGKAVWHPEGAEPLPYADFRLKPDTLAFNSRPDESSTGARAR